MGVELQVTAGKPNLRDWDAVRSYKQRGGSLGRCAFRRWRAFGTRRQIGSPAAAENVRLSIRAAELLGSSVILLAFFEKKRAGHVAGKIRTARSSRCCARWRRAPPRPA